MTIKGHILRNHKLEGWPDRIKGRWSYRQLVADPKWFHGWISFDAATWNPDDGLIYCGLNSLDGDLLYTFDPTTERFTSLQTKSWTDAFDVKIHRTILRNPVNGCLYFGTSLLHDLEQQQEARGGKLVVYEPRTGKYSLIGVPAPKLYLQSIAADWERSLIYSFTYPAEAVYKTDLRTGQSSLVTYLGNAIMLAQPHNAVVDNRGWLWGTCGETRAWDEAIGPQPIRLFKYHPDDNCFVWYDHGLSRKSDSAQLLPDPPKPDVEDALQETRHKEDYGFCDAMVFDGERYIYAGTVAGVLCRIDTLTGTIEKVAHVMAGGRFPALAIRDGILYGGGGMKGRTQLVRWDTRSDDLKTWWDLVDPALDERPARIHEIAMDNNHRLFLCENDHHYRSSYLWTADLD